MVDVLRIKRRAVGGAAGPPATLAAAEIAFNEQDNTLYYGKGNSGGIATSIIPIAGSGLVGAYLPLTGGTLSGGLSFGSAVSPGDITTNLSRHISLYGSTYGWSITSGTLNHVGDSHRFLTGGITSAAFTSTANYFNFPVGIKVSGSPQADLHVGLTSATARIYNTMTDSLNGEWAYMGSWASNVARYGTDKNGSGVARNIQIMIGGVNKLDYGSGVNHPNAFAFQDGEIIIGGNNTPLYLYTRGFAVNTYYSGGWFLGPGSVNQHGGVFDFDVGIGAWRWMTSPSPGNAGAFAPGMVIGMAYKRGASGPLLTLGDWPDWSAAFPALRRNGTSLEVRLADDSAYAPFRASVLYGDTLGGLAEAYAQAQWTMSTFGTITWAGSRLSWLGRIILIPISQPLSSWIEFNQPTVDIPASQVYNGVARNVESGILLNSWEALYWDNSIGGFRIVNYSGYPFTAQSSWIFVASVNGDGGAGNTSLKLGTGQQLAYGQSTINGYQSQYIWNNSSSPQNANISISSSRLRNYQTYTDDLNNEFAYMGEWNGGVAYYGTGKLGTGGVLRDVQFQRGSVPKLFIENAGVRVGDNTKFTVGNLGASTNIATTFGIRDSASIATTAGAYLYSTEYHYFANNVIRLQTSGYRRIAGTAWQGTGFRLQYAVDSSFTDGSRSFVEIGTADAAGNGQVVLGTTGLDRLIVSSTGAISRPGSLAVTGIVTGPTAATGTNTTQLATTAFVQTNSSNITVLTVTVTTTLTAGTKGLVVVNNTAAVTITLPPSPAVGNVLTIKDGLGNAGTAPITISGSIDGATSVILNFAFSWVTICYIGTKWVQI